MEKLKKGDRVRFIGTPKCPDVTIGVKGTITDVRSDSCDLKWDDGIVGDNRDGHGWSLDEFKSITSWKSRYGK